MSFLHFDINLHDNVVDTLTETCDWFDDIKIVKLLFGDLRSKSDRGDHVISETGRTSNCTDWRTDHTLRGDTRQTQAWATATSTAETYVERTTEPRVEPADPEQRSPGNGSSITVCCGGLGMTRPAAARCALAQVADTGSGAARGWQLSDSWGASTFLFVHSSFSFLSVHPSPNLK